MKNKSHRNVEAFFNKSRDWYRALFNVIPLEWSDKNLPLEVKIKDETLREGEETPGVRLSLSDKLKVAEQIEDIGIKEIEVGYSGAISEHYNFTKELKKQGYKLKLSSHTRAYTQESHWKKEIDKVVESGADIVNLVIKASNSQLKATPWLKKEDVPERIFNCIKYAKNCNKYVAFGLADPARTSFDYVVASYLSAYNAGADRLYIYDGPGCANMEAIEYLVKLVRVISQNNAEIAVHCHNDFGLAVANSISGIKAGATVVDSVVNGMGDRAGNASFEELICALTVLYGINTGIDIKKIYPLSQLVSKIYNIPIPFNKPIIGESAFRHETDSHVACLLRGEWDSFEVIKAEALGRKRSLEFGPTTTQESDGALSAKLEKMGIKYNKEFEKKIILWIKKQLLHKNFVSEKDLERQIKKLIKN